MPRSTKTVKDNLDGAFEDANILLAKKDKPIIDLVPVSAGTKLMMPSRPEELNPETQEDYVAARVAYKDLMFQGNRALEGVLDLALGGDSPRAYEVAAILIKAMSDVATASITLHEKMKPLRASSEPVSQGHTINAQGNANIVFTGTNSDLMDLIDSAKGNK